MSNEIKNYEELLNEDEKDIKTLSRKPTLIEYHNILSETLYNKIPTIFVAVDIINNQMFTKSCIFIVQHLVPEFKNTSSDSFSFRHFTEGITNKIVCITDSNTGFSVNIRTFGTLTEYMIDRKQEIFIESSIKNIKIYGTFLNGIVYTYIPGRTLFLGDLIDLNLFKQTAIAIAKYHKNEPELIKSPMLFVTLRKWLRNVPDEYVDKKKKAYDITILKNELIFLEKLLKNNTDIVLCHNDLLLKNFIKGENDIKLIDYEYSSYNYRAFDLANHFCEWCGFECVWDSYPNSETQRRFINIYYNEYNGKNENENKKIIDQLIQDIKIFELCPNFFWGVWALIQGALSTIDFDYVDYAHKRFERYFVIKNRLINNGTIKNENISL